MKKILYPALIILAFIITFSCYKEDTNVLYSRQYVVAETLKDLNDKLDTINNNITNLQTVINNLSSGEPVSVEYTKNLNGENVGVTIFYEKNGTKTEYFVPFAKDGKDGKDGVTPSVNIGTNGNWFVNNVDTNVKAKGTDGANGTNGTNGINGKTPIIGAKQDPNNPSDDTFYWTIKYEENQEPTFILENGNKVPATAKDGINSPIKSVTENAEKTKVTICVEDPVNSSTQKCYEVPLLKDIRFDIQPEQSKIGVDDASARYNKLNNTLNFQKPGEEIEFPFSKDDELEEVYATLPQNWTYRVDKVNKKIYVKSPSVDDLVSSANIGEIVFFARDSKGNSYSRNLSVKVENGLFINYFFAENHNQPTETPTSLYNAIKLNKTSTGGVRHISVLHIESTPSNFGAPSIFASNNTIPLTEAEKLEAKLKSKIYYDFVKTDALKYKNIVFSDFIYQPDSVFLRSSNVDDKVPTNFFLTTDFLKNASGAVEEGQRSVYVKPVPWDTYIARTPIHTTENRTDVQTIRLKRAVMKVRLYMKNPKKYLGLDSSENFDANRVVLYHASPYGIVNGTSTGYANYFGTTSGNKLIHTKAANVSKYDNSTDILSGEFNAFPVQGTSSLKLYIEYTKQDGSKVLKVVHAGRTFIQNTQGANIDAPLPIGGSVVTYRIDVPHTSTAGNSTYNSSMSIWMPTGYETINQINEGISNNKPNNVLGGVREVYRQIDEF